GDVMRSAGDFPEDADASDVRPGVSRRELLTLVALGLAGAAPGSALAAGPSGQLTYGVHISLAPTWFGPAETTALITPYMVLYALHDAPGHGSASRGLD